jgi:BirA family transcriptional regulator, biotin operon repressor / biotin---[acetyl-CoA-carboxylase] ligase
MPTPFLKLDLSALRDAVSAHRSDVAIDWVAETTSTNQILAQTGNGYALFGADRQTAGRGRRQRPWLSVEGQSLTFSLRLPAYQGAALPYLPSLPLMVGLAVISAVEQWSAARGFTITGPLALKWPNDVLCNGHKVAGILMESKSALVIGIGINVFFSQQLQQSLRQDSKQNSGHSLPPGGLLPSLLGVDPQCLAALVAATTLAVLSIDSAHRRGGMGANAQRWNALHHFHGHEVCLTDGPEVVREGKVQGIGDSGELLLLDRLGQIQRVLSGDLSMRSVKHNTKHDSKS